MGKVVKTKSAATAATSKKGLSVQIETSDETVNTAPVVPPAPPAPPVMPPPPPIQETANVESTATRKDVMLQQVQDVLLRLYKVLALHLHRIGL